MKNILLDKISLSNQRLSDARLELKLIRKKLYEAETEQISAKIENEKLIEELRVMSNSEVSYEKTEIQKGNEILKEKLPSLFKLIEEIDSANSITYKKGDSK